MSRSEELDILLYAWLSEGDARRAEVRFANYFRRAFSDLSRYARSLGAEASTAQDISQQSLIKLFNHLGLSRCAAAEAVRVATEELKPLTFGAMHERLVRAWVQQIVAFRDAALGFRVSIERESQWRQLRMEVNARVDPLVRQGVHFLEEVRSRLGALLFAPIAADVRDGSSTVWWDPPQDSVDEALRSFVLTLLKRAEVQDAADIEKLPDCLGSVGFVRHTSTVCEKLPALAIPSNGLAYTMVKNQFMDSLKRRRPEQVDSMPDIVDEKSQEVLDQLDFGDPPMAEAVAESSSEEDAPNEATAGVGRESEIEGRYRAFLELLRAPLTRAEGALAQASSLARAAADQARVDSLRAKYDRLMAVLKALRETPQPTEDEIAARLGITRNQVKYAIERIREEFSHFFPDLAGDAQQRRKHQGAD
jgi:DNA-directed RNA polymerase specialized sigma24 family protein